MAFRKTKYKCAQCETLTDSFEHAREHCVTEPEPMYACPHCNELYETSISAKECCISKPLIAFECGRCHGLHDDAIDADECCTTGENEYRPTVDQEALERMGQNRLF